MDYPELTNLTNFTNMDEISPDLSMRYIVHEIMFTINCAISVLADIAIIYTILRFKKLHTIPNTFLTNWAIADLCSLFVTPSGYRIISVVDHIGLPLKFMCTLFEVGALLHVNVSFFVILTTTDWLLEAYFRRCSGIFRKYYKYIIAVTWIFSVINCSVATGLCINNSFYFHVTEMFYLCSYAIVLLMVVVLQCTRAIQKCKKKPLEHPTLMLTLATGFTLSCLAAFILALTQIHYVMDVIGTILMISGSILNFALLYHLHPDFQSCFLQAIRRTNHRYQESLEVDNTEPYQVSFHNPTEELLTNDR